MKLYFMVLIVHAFIHGVDCPHIYYPCPDYEFAFLQLTHLVSEGCILVSAELRDQDSSIRLPVEAFDGQPLQDQLRNLQSQWEALIKR